MMGIVSCPVLASELLVLLVQTYCADVVANLGGVLAFHDTHDDKEGNSVHDGTSGDAVDEPLFERIPQTELALHRGGRLLGCSGVALDDAVTGAGLHLNVILGALLLRGLDRVGRKAALQELLPVVVGRGSDEGEADEAE